MSGKRPKSVCTDGCHAMRAALRTVLPGVPHRLCAWHVAQNTNENFNVERHPWVIQKYLTRELWAQAFVTGNFFATVKSTSRCEGMHSYMKRYVKHTGTLFEFMSSIDKARISMGMLELEADFYSRVRRPVTRYSHLRELENYVGSIYTERAFARFRREVEREKGLSSRLVQILNGVRRYLVMRYRVPNRVVNVSVHDNEGMIKCSCKKFHTEGIPCRHAINIMKVEDMVRIPDAMVLQRWRIECGKNTATVAPFTIDVEDTKIFRQATLRVLCNKICEDATESESAYEEAKNALEKLHETLLRMKMLATGANGASSSKSRPFNSGGHGVRGQGSTQRALPTCSTCRGVRHTKKSCKMPKVPSRVKDDE
ncbi:Zinc finger, PMZ-type [Corchorus olitorius]|uniref:Zinc finger, PMZ-type n=1 Tax=Corchorus olitorius TaxID=93759 RepID=A0A1R3GHQ6_9ROSI|nr:Zinc finger, PMZ-type [Corchorus olitorius]